MATQEEIDVKVKAETSSFDSGAQAVIGKVRGMSEAIEAAKASLAGFGAAIAGAFAVREVLEFARNLGDVGDKLNDIAEVTGGTTRDIQAFRFAVQASGGEADDVGLAFQTLSRKVADAVQNGGDAKASFDLLGVSLKDSQGKVRGMFEILGQIATRYSETANGLDKNVNAQELFSRAAAKMIPILNGGAQGIEQYRQQAERLGITLSQDTVNAFDDLNSSIKIMDATVNGISMNIGMNLSGSLKDAVDGITSFAAEINRALSESNEFTATIKILDAFLKAVLQTISFVTAGAIQLYQALMIVSTAIAGVFSMDNAKGVEATGKKIMEHWEELKRAGNNYQAYMHKLWDNDNKGEKKEAGGTKTGVGFAPAKSAGGNGLTDAQQLGRAKLEAARSEAQQELQIYQAFLENKKEAGQLSNMEMLNDLRAHKQQAFKLEQDSFRKELQLLRDKPLEHQKTLDKMSQSERKFRMDMLRLDRAMMQEQKATWSKFADPVTSSTSSAMTSLITGASTFNEAMLGIANSLASAFIDIGMKMVAEWIMNQLIGEATAATTAISTIGAHAAEAGAAAYASTAAIPIVGPGLAPAAAMTAYAGAMSFTGMVLPSAAGGYDVPRDTLAQIHEREMVLPANLSDKIRNMADGGGGQPINFVVNAVDAKSVKKLLNDHGGELARVLKKQVSQFNPATRGSYA